MICTDIKPGMLVIQCLRAFPGLDTREIQKYTGLTQDQVRGALLGLIQEERVRYEGNLFYEVK